MEKLIKKAIRTLEKNYGLNEITLSDGKNTVHLVRNTPFITYYTPGNYLQQYSQQY